MGILKNPVLGISVPAATVRIKSPTNSRPRHSRSEAVDSDATPRRNANDGGVTGTSVGRAPASPAVVGGRQRSGWPSRSLSMRHSVPVGH